MSKIDFSEMTRAERIQHRRNTLKLSPQYISRYIGVNRVTFLKWEKGEVEDIAWPKFIKLAEVLLTTPHWLEYGAEHEEYTYNDSAGDIKNTLTGKHIIKGPAIPVFSIESGNIKPKNGFYVDMPAKSCNVYAVQLKDVSEEMKAQAGDALIIDKEAELTPGEEVLITTEGESQFYVFNYERDGEINLTGHAGRKILNKNDIAEISAVVAVARNSYVKKN